MLNFWSQYGNVIIAICFIIGTFLLGLNIGWWIREFEQPKNCNTCLQKLKCNTNQLSKE